MSAAARGWARALATLVTVMGIDQASKALVTASLARGEDRSVFFGVELTNIRNRGVAFGAFADGGVVVALISAIALVGVLAYFAAHAAHPRIWLPVGVLLGGAVGNLVDRARAGAVTDFIDPIAWPAFNLADVAIVAGVLGLLYVVESDRSGRDAASVAGG